MEIYIANVYRVFGDFWMVEGLDRFWVGRVGWRDKAVRSFRLRLHSGLRQSGRVLFYRVGNLGLRPRLVYVGLSALGCGGLANGEAKQIP